MGWDIGFVRQQLGHGDLASIEHYIAPCRSKTGGALRGEEMTKGKVKGMDNEDRALATTLRGDSEVNTRRGGGAARERCAGRGVGPNAAVPKAVQPVVQAGEQCAPDAPQGCVHLDAGRAGQEGEEGEGSKGSQGTQGLNRKGDWAGRKLGEDFGYATEAL